MSDIWWVTYKKESREPLCIYHSREWAADRVRDDEGLVSVKYSDNPKWWAIVRKDNRFPLLVYPNKEIAAEIVNFSGDLLIPIAPTEGIEGNVMLMGSINIATALHHGQHRKHQVAVTALPYITHPLEVMKTLWVWGIGDEDVLSAAVCHDVLEDCAVTYEILVKHIGKRAADIVQELTFIAPQDKEEKRVAKASYMATFGDKSIESLVVKLSDRFHNVEDYMLWNLPYAMIYFHKADAVFEAWSKRKGEIIERFGESVQFKIKTRYDLLWNLNFNNAILP